MSHYRSGGDIMTSLEIGIHIVFCFAIPGILLGEVELW